MGQDLAKGWFFMYRKSKWQNAARQMRAVKFYIRNHYYMVLLGIFCLVGVAAGTLAAAMPLSDELGAAQALIDSFLENRESAELKSLFLLGLGGNLTMLALLVFGGCSTISRPVCIAVLLWKGIEIGYTYTAFFHLYGFRAMIFLLLYLFGPDLCSALLLMKMGEYAVEKSSSFRAQALPNRPAGPAPGPREYLLKCVVILILTLLVSLLSAQITVLLRDQYWL